MVLCVCVFLIYMLNIDLMIVQFSGGNVIYGNSPNFVLEVWHSVIQQVNGMVCQ